MTEESSEVPDSGAFSKPTRGREPRTPSLRVDHSQGFFAVDMGDLGLTFQLAQVRIAELGKHISGHVLFVTAAGADA